MWLAGEEWYGNREEKMIGKNCFYWIYNGFADLYFPCKMKKEHFWAELEWIDVGDLHSPRHSLSGFLSTRFPHGVLHKNFAHEMCSRKNSWMKFESKTPSWGGA